MAAPIQPSSFSHGIPHPGFDLTVTYSVPLDQAVPLFELANEKNLGARIEAQSGDRGLAQVTVQAGNLTNPLLGTSLRALAEVHDWLLGNGLTQ